MGIYDGKEIKREKARKQFSVYFGNNDIELLKAGLLHAYHVKEVQNGKRIKKILDVLNHTLDVAAITQSDINDLFEHDKYITKHNRDGCYYHCKSEEIARSYLVLFKDVCPPILREKIFQYELERCYQEAGFFKKRIIKKFQNFINRTELDKQMSHF